MEKIELKHLAPYLPYGLQVMMPCMHDSPEPNIDELDSLCVSGKINVQRNSPIEFGEFKPILRPLSGLTKEIAINGETLMPVKELFQMSYESVFNHRFDGEWENEFNDGDENIGITAIERLPKVWRYGLTVELPKSFLFSANGDFMTIPTFTMYNKLFEWHFDVFGLIEKGLAIDINTIK
jgi:hypothetical protein